MNDEPMAPPRTEHDGRVVIWFFSWLGGFALCTAGLVIVVFTDQWAMQFIEAHPVAFLACFLLGLACMAAALSPWYRGIRCRNCRRRLYRMKVESDLKTGNTPLAFHCEPCQVIWETGLVSGPGNPHGSTRA